LADRPDASFKIGVIQANIPTWVKLTEQGVKASIVDYTQGYLALADQGVDGVLMPEGALPFVWEGDNRRYSALYRAIRDRGVLAWVGTFLAQPEAQPDPAEGRTMRYTQSLVAIAGDGEILSRYNKIKLVPLGEYIPFEGILGKILGRLSPLESVLVSGKTDQVFMSPWGPVAAAICYEPPFSGLIRRQVEAGGQFILTASNLDPYGQVLMAQHEAHDVMRSIETDRWLVRATNTGYSGFIDPHGRVQWRSEAARGVVHADWIYGRSSQTLYVRWGNWLTLVLLGLGILSYAKLFLN
jgi:apolipoprotein N-acyltransferase